MPDPQDVLRGSVTDRYVVEWEIGAGGMAARPRDDGHFIMIAPLLALNIVVNLYPALLQQSNKRRVDRVLESLNPDDVAH